MSTRIYLPIYNRWCNRHYSIKLSTRYYPPRHLLCCSSLPLRPKNRSSIRNLCSLHTLIPTIHWTNTSRAMNKSPILHYIYWSKFNILPTTLPWTKRNASTILRLSGRPNKMKRSILHRITSILHRTPILYLHPMRSLCSPTSSNCKNPHTYIYRMKR